MSFFDFHHHHLNEQFGIYNLSLMEDPPNQMFSAGIHPKDISNYTEENFVWLKHVSKLENCLAIGECGLDGLIEVDENLQKEIFEKQIYFANELRKPIIIHCVKRYSQLNQFKKIAKVPMIIHGFNKRKTIGNDLLKNQFCLSFGKSVLYNVNLQDFLREVPLNKIFIETDDATLDIKDLYLKVSEIKNISLDDLKQIITQNLKNLNISV